jgi:hypothetical protein
MCATNIKNGTGFQLGEVHGETRKELCKNALGHCGLIREPDENVGKTVMFTKEHRKYPARQGKFVIVATQMIWGYDENGGGEYKTRTGYRLMPADGSDSFGIPAAVYEIEFV